MSVDPASLSNNAGHPKRSNGDVISSVEHSFTDSSQLKSVSASVI